MALDFCLRRSISWILFAAAIAEGRDSHEPPSDGELRGTHLLPASGGERLKLRRLLRLAILVSNHQHAEALHSTRCRTSPWHQLFCAQAVDLPGQAQEHSDRRRASPHSRGGS